MACDTTHCLLEPQTLMFVYSENKAKGPGIRLSRALICSGDEGPGARVPDSPPTGRRHARGRQDEELRAPPGAQ
mgnify:CR=1 FL=1